ncbi:hypothetical protein LDVICp206 [lymphocystis disease virus-China]|uniref:Uncharacterized protein n=1 Tax=lymphocystis disease virus-China TaxID=256729 RepID=Q677Q8_9VIRU|nr:hypothetical protein LDVICp206 [lymphocystis disease virus-China]AAU11049.1 hypothetical protein [lymphocystis disease virus-China]
MSLMTLCIINDTLGVKGLKGIYSLTLGHTLYAHLYISSVEELAFQL